MLQGCSLVKILSDNGFSYEEYHENYSSYVVKNINIINFEPKIDYIIVAENIRERSLLYYIANSN